LSAAFYTKKYHILPDLSMRRRLESKARSAFLLFGKAPFRRGIVVDFTSRFRYNQIRAEQENAGQGGLL